MGMYGTILRVTPATLEELKTNPELFEELREDLELVCELDKSWHGLHFMLTGSAIGTDSILSKVIMSGTSLNGEEDENILGEPYYLTPSEVQEVTTALQNIPEAEFKAKYNPKAMRAEGIYPSIWDRADSEALSELVDTFNQLVEFYTQAAQQGNATVIVVE